MNGRNCDGFVVHLRAEHRRLDELIRRIEALIARSRSRMVDYEARNELPHGLRELHQELAAHFTEEENGGCLEEAVCNRPSLSVEFRRLEHEHPILLNRLERIIRRAERQGGRAEKLDEAEFAAFVENLSAHEDAEKRVLSSGLGIAEL